MVKKRGNGRPPALIHSQVNPNPFRKMHRSEWSEWCPASVRLSLLPTNPLFSWNCQSHGTEFFSSTLTIFSLSRFRSLVTALTLRQHLITRSIPYYRALTDKRSRSLDSRISFCPREDNSFPFSLLFWQSSSPDLSATTLQWTLAFLQSFSRG